MGRPKGSKNKVKRGIPKGNNKVKLEETSIKCKRGRPRKEPKIKRGRPKGIQNSTNIVKCKRGRPKGSKNKRSSSDLPTHNGREKMFSVPEGYKEPKSKKFLGYCKCGFMINSGDLTDKDTYICHGCNSEFSKGKIQESRKGSEERAKSKKEYLEETVYSTKLIELTDHIQPVEVPEIEIIEEEVNKDNPEKEV